MAVQVDGAQRLTEEAKLWNSGLVDTDIRDGTLLTRS